METYFPLTPQISLGNTVTNLHQMPGIFRLVAQNVSGVQAYVQLFDALAANVTLGTTMPATICPISPGDNEDVVEGIRFGTAISAAATTTPTGTTAATCHLFPSVR